MSKVDFNFALPYMSLFIFRRARLESIQTKVKYFRNLLTTLDTAIFAKYLN